LVDDGLPHRVVLRLPAAGTGRAAELSAAAAGAVSAGLAETPAAPLSS